jgi:methylated-DNA-protein-cysteine methyltransferase related protein
MKIRPLKAPQRDEPYSRVWALVRQVPPGRVISYGQVAALLDPPIDISGEDYQLYGARWVGQAMRGCPADVPWQRVLNAQGKISLPGPGGAEQRALLEDEGVNFNESDRVDLRRYGWSGPNAPQQAELF